MQDEQVRVGARNDRIGTAIVIAELDQGSLFVEQFDDRANLPARQILGPQIGQKRHNVEDYHRHPCILGHQTTQQVTNRGIGSPLRMI
jgi:hypothetical protein